MPPAKKPSLETLRLPSHWVVHTDYHPRSEFRSILKLETEYDGRIWVQLDNVNRRGIGWILAFAGTYRHGVRMGHFLFEMADFYPVLTEQDRNPAALDEWLEREMNNHAQWQLQAAEKSAEQT